VSGVPATEVTYGPVSASRLEGGHVLRLLLDRPKGNVLDRAMLEGLAAALAAHRDDPHLRLVLLRGAGGQFSFGASVEEHRPAQAPQMLRTLHGFVRELAMYPVPVAALVEGRCLGGAFEVALCCHLVLAAPEARFACPEIKLGVFPPVLATVGARRLGGALVERLLLTGEELDAATAAQLGLVAALLPGQADAETEALAWYRARLAPLSAYSLRVATRAVREGSGMLEAIGAPLDRAERTYLERLLLSHDGNEGIEAFLARRPPQWTDA
jgi:cyclohexa-1,5-dienecarbonyl-CoA hydratase